MDVNNEKRGKKRPINKSQDNASEMTKGKKKAKELPTLSDACLLKIFMYLSTKDLIRVERVCQQWGQVSRSVWSHKTHFDLIDIAFKSRKFDVTPEQVFKRILTLSNGSFTSLKLRAKGHTITLKSVLHLLNSELLPNLTTLSMYPSFNLMSGLEIRFPNLQSVEVSMNGTVTGPLNDQILSDFLSKTPNLKSFLFRFGHDVRGTFLKHLPSTVDTLALEMCCSFGYNHLLHRLQRGDLRLVHLELILEPGTEGNPDEFPDILNCVSSTLETLRLRDESGNSFKYLAKFKKLKKLSLESFTDIFARDLQYVVERCPQIKALNLSQLKCFIPNEATKLYKAISVMPNLERLDYFSCCNQAFTMMRLVASGVPKLKIFSCHSEEIDEYFSCKHPPNIKTHQIVRLLKTHPNLEELDMYGWNAFGWGEADEDRVDWKEILAGAGKILSARNQRLPPLKIVLHEGEALEDDDGEDIDLETFNHYGTSFKVCEPVKKEDYHN